MHSHHLTLCNLYGVTKHTTFTHRGRSTYFVTRANSVQFHLQRHKRICTRYIMMCLHMRNGKLVLCIEAGVSTEQYVPYAPRLVHAR